MNLVLRDYMFTQDVGFVPRFYIPYIIDVVLDGCIYIAGIVPLPDVYMG